MEKTNLVFMPYAQAHVVHGNNGVYLVSYKTTVASLDKNGNLAIRGLYSTTTRKHIMVREFCPNVADFSTVKYLATHNEVLNVNTGELISLE